MQRHNDEIDNSHETMVNTVSGRVVVKESGHGIANLVVHVFDIDSNLKPSKFVSLINSNNNFRTASTITDITGSFRVEFYLPALKKRVNRRGLNLVVLVTAPEESETQSTLIYVPQTARINAAMTESYLIKIPQADLEKAGITLPGFSDSEVEPPDAVSKRITKLAQRDVSVAAAQRDALRVKVSDARKEFDIFRNHFRPSFERLLSSVMNESSLDTFVPRDGPVRQTNEKVINTDLDAVINSGKDRAPVKTRIALTREQADLVRDKLDSGGKISFKELHSIINGSDDSKPTQPYYLRTYPTSLICRKLTQEEKQCADVLAGREPQPPRPIVTPPPGDTAGAGVEKIKTSDIPIFLARLVNTMTSPEEGLLTELEPSATKDSVSNNIQDLSFKPSPADVPAIYRFSSIQIAFRDVWQEAIDEGILSIAENAYDQIVLLGGEPNLQNNPNPISALRAEFSAINHTLRQSNFNGSDFNGTMTKSLAMAQSGLAFQQSGSGLSSPTTGAVNMAGGINISGLANGSGTTNSSGPIDVFGTDSILDGPFGPTRPVSDPGYSPGPSDLLSELEQRMQEPYAFTTFAANRKERSINFGILVEYELLLTPIAYHAGRLAKTITLAPKEVQRYTKTVKRHRKRVEKEVEKHIQIQKDEMTKISKIEQEIIRKANTKTNFQLSSEFTAKDPTGSGEAVTKTSFEREAATVSDSVKKTYHEAVVKASRDTDEYITDITTEESEDFELSESGEISNPSESTAATFLLYDLQRRYRVTERIHKITPIVLVAQEMPSPHEINESWMITHDWILRRVLLDDAFLPALNYLSHNVVGDRIALRELSLNINQQRKVIEELKNQLGVVRTRIATYRTLLEKALLNAAEKKAKGGNGGGFDIGWDDVLFPVTGLGLELIEGLGELAFSGSSNAGVSETSLDSIKETIQRTVDEERDLLMRLEREVTALNALTETYTKALAENYNHRTQILAARIHWKQNIHHYHQAIMNHEPPDQRYLRLHEVPVPIFKPNVSYKFQKFEPIQGALNTVLHGSRDLENALNTDVYEAEVLPDL
jgi:bacterioferritin (cytochrome b1)